MEAEMAEMDAEKTRDGDDDHDKTDDIDDAVHDDLLQRRRSRLRPGLLSRLGVTGYAVILVRGGIARWRCVHPAAGFSARQSGNFALVLRCRRVLARARHSRTG